MGHLILFSQCNLEKQSYDPPGHSYSHAMKSEKFMWTWRVQSYSTVPGASNRTFWKWNPLTFTNAWFGRTLSSSDYYEFICFSCGPRSLRLAVCCLCGLSKPVSLWYKLSFKNKSKLNVLYQILFICSGERTIYCFSMGYGGYVLVHLLLLQLVTLQKSDHFERHYMCCNSW